MFSAFSAKSVESWCLPDFAENTYMKHELSEPIIVSANSIFRLSLRHLRHLMLNQLSLNLSQLNFNLSQRIRNV